MRKKKTRKKNETKLLLKCSKDDDEIRKAFVRNFLYFFLITIFFGEIAKETFVLNNNN